MAVVLWCHAIPQRPREKAGGGVCDKWFMYVQYLGNVILLFFVKLLLLQSVWDGEGFSIK
jgi:hypothetical protein